MLRNSCGVDRIRTSTNSFELCLPIVAIYCRRLQIYRGIHLPDSEEVIQIPSLQYVDFKLPPELHRLQDLAYNLWWTWNFAARELLSSIDRSTWARYHNPVELLLNIDLSHWETLVQDESFMAKYAEVVRAFDTYMNARRETWFRRTYPDFDGGRIAYFSMEYGMHPSLAIYSGGLGVLSGDHCKSASDLGLPFIAVGLLYRLGYFRQTVDADGIQQHIYPAYDFQRLPIRQALSPQGRELIVKIELPGRSVAAQAWIAQVGRVPLLLLDTDLPENDPADRPITNMLYVRGREMRLTQEAVLGIGGARALEELGIQPAVWHINEGHSALLQIHRLARGKSGRRGPLAAAIETLGATTVFTTHTPVPAGNEQFDYALARQYFDVWADSTGYSTEQLLGLGRADHGASHQPFNLTALALRSSSYANGVSRLNAAVADRMWRHLVSKLPKVGAAIDSITNGVHLPTWVGPEMQSLLSRTVGVDWAETQVDLDPWDKILELPAADLWRAHMAQKERLIRFCRERLRDQYARHGRSPTELRAVVGFLDPEVLTVGFARRFATYKRAELLFSDLHRLRALINHAERPIQIVLAGKAHPADRPGQELIQYIFNLSQEPELKGRVVFLENYDMRIGRMLVQGCDVWLNTPKRPQEACGTSGQKAAANGVLNCSILDGWWPEAFDGTNGWAIGEANPSLEDWQLDQFEARSLYQTLEEKIVPTFYDRDESGVPIDWTAMMKRSIAGIGPRFSSHRMVRDYLRKAYMPLLNQESKS